MQSTCMLLLLIGTISNQESKPMNADFEGDAIGAAPRHWTVAKTGAGEGSVWKIVEDATAPKGSKVLAQTAESPGSMFNLCVADGTNFKDVEVSVAFKAVKGASDQGGGIVWRYVDANNYYVARYNPLEDNYRLYQVKAGKRTQFGGKEKLKVKEGQWHTLTIKMVGDSITCSLNGKVEFETKDSTYTKAGQVGLWTKADAQTYFDNFRASEVKP